MLTALLTKFIKTSLRHHLSTSLMLLECTFRCWDVSTSVGMHHLLVAQNGWVSKGQAEGRGGKWQKLLVVNTMGHSCTLLLVAGSRRGIGVNEERDQTLNQLLTELDGFEGREGVLLLAATNRAEVRRNFESMLCCAVHYRCSLGACSI